MPAPSGHRRRLTAALACATVLALAACGGPPAPAGGVAAGGEAVTETNCGVPVTVPEPPQRIYALYQPAIEMVHALGVTDRLVGTAFLDAQVLPEYAQAQSQLDYLPELPSREALLATTPDFVVSGFNDVFASSGSESLGTRGELAGLGVQSWIFGPLCPSADGLSDEAIDPASVTMDTVYADVRGLGRLFGVSERAEEVVTGMQQRIEAVRARVAGEPSVRVAVVSPSDDGTFRIAGGPDFVTRILEMAGAENVFADLTGKRNIPVGVEELIARDPDVILTSTCCDGSYTRADGEPDAQTLRENPALARVPAVREGQVHPFLFADRAAGVRVPHAVETVAGIVHPE